nr:ATP-dependent 6-phosphofructokinase [Tanacetum cinerariifolium]
MATDSSAATAAAARRRRIAEKGAERLALITGRTPSISSSSSPLPPPISDEITDSLLNKDTPSNNEIAGDDVTSDEQPMFHNSEAKAETYAETSSETRDIQSFLDTLTEQNPSISTSNRSQNPRSQARFKQTFSPKRLRPAIKASENTRTYCSVVMALLVLLSYADFPVLGSGFIKNIILFRPLFLLLVTNITIVAAPLLLEKVKQIERRVSSTGDAGFGNNIGTILEWGMLMKTGSSALFMDFSIYSVLVVCGMSYMMRFGW